MTNIDASVEFLRLKFRDTEGDIFFTSLPNEKGGALPLRDLVTRDISLFEAWLPKWSRAGRGCYVAKSTIRPGERGRSLETIHDMVCVAPDIDFKSILETPEQAEAAVRGFALPPSALVHSGHGLHAYWWFDEPVRASPESIALVKSVEQALGVVFAGDPAPRHPAALMRLPGSLNTKGEVVPVGLLELSDRRYSPRDILEAARDTRALLLPRDRPEPVREDVPENPFLALAREFQTRAPIDVKDRLERMRLGGAGETSIHATQVAVTASLVSSGFSSEDAIAAVLAATRNAAGDAARSWNWTAEEKDIRRMCESWAKKIADKDQARGDQARGEANGSNGSARMYSFSDAKADRDKASAKETKGLVPKLVESVLEALRSEGVRVLLSEGEIWFCRHCIWSQMTTMDEQRVRSLIQEGLEAIERGGDVKPANAAWKLFCEHPKLYRATVPWLDLDRTGLLACTNGVLNIYNGVFVPLTSEHYARRVIPVAYIPGRDCVLFERFLAEAFQDAPDAAEIIGVVQEFFGAALAIHLLPREMRKALLAIGASRTGKTELLRTLAELLGGPFAAISIGEMGGNFALQGFLDAHGWIRDDAINEGDQIDGARFKAIVTGENFSIDRKNRSPIVIKLDIPVAFSANSLPKSRESTEAVSNRSIIISMQNVVSEAAAADRRLALGVPPHQSLGSWFVECEGPGILNWALAGLQRLLARGRYDLPAAITDAAKVFRDANNPVLSWVKSAIVKDADYKVSMHDVRLSFQGHQYEEEGDSARAMGSHVFFERLRATLPGVELSTDTNGNRFIVGSKLTDYGLRLWELAKEAPDLSKKARTRTDSRVAVNVPWRRR